MTTIVCELMEPRRLLSGAGASAPVVEDRDVIRADLQQLHFDRLELRQVAKTDREGATATTTGDRMQVHNDLNQLRIDQRQNPQNVTADLTRLEGDEGVLATAIRNLTASARTDRQNALGKIGTDQTTLRLDRHQLFLDRHAKN